MAYFVRKADYPRFTSGETDAAEDGWKIFHTESELEAAGLMSAHLPGVLLNPYTNKLLVLQSFTNEYTEGGIWEGSARYGERAGNQPPEGGDAGTGGTVSFETGGGMMKITQALLTRQTQALAGIVAADHKKAIGWDGEQVNGTDVVSPIFHWNETHFIPSSTADTLDYQRTVEELTGTMNAETFRKREAGEALFMGASGSRKNSAVWEINFKFASQRNQKNLTIGDIGGIDKLGWDFLDVQYASRVDANFRAPRPIVVRVQKVYEFGDFGKLGIGTGGT